MRGVGGRERERERERERCLILRSWFTGLQKLAHLKSAI
jgi:hypothetical protein